MPKGNSRFTKRLRTAVQAIRSDEDLQLLSCDSDDLYTPMWQEGGIYKWIKVMGSDGLLVGERSVNKGDLPDSTAPEKLLVGLVIQSEDATSQTKPNPLGKAALPHIPNGIWVISQGALRRLDRVFVLFVLPQGAAVAQQKKFEIARRYVQNAAAAMPDAEALVIPRGASAERATDDLHKVARRLIIGRGRPRGS